MLASTLGTLMDHHWSGTSGKPCTTPPPRVKHDHPTSPTPSAASLTLLVGVEMQFYPQMCALCQRRIEAWGAAQRAQRGRHCNETPPRRAALVPKRGHLPQASGSQ